LTSAIIAPGATDTLLPSSSTSMPPKCRRTSTSIPSLWLCPFRLEPPARKVTPMPLSRPKAITLPMSSSDFAMTTAFGSLRYGLASDA